MEFKGFVGPNVYLGEDENGNMFYVNRSSRQMTPVEDGKAGEELTGGMTTEEPFINSLLPASEQRENAHSEIDKLLFEEEITKLLSTGQKRGPLDALGEMLASKLIGQHQSTGYIPQKGDPELSSRDLAESRSPWVVGLFDKIMGMTNK